MECEGQAVAAATTPMSTEWCAEDSAADLKLDIQYNESGVVDRLAKVTIHHYDRLMTQMFSAPTLDTFALGASEAVHLPPKVTPPSRVILASSCPSPPPPPTPKRKRPRRRDVRRPSRPKRGQWNRLRLRLRRWIRSRSSQTSVGKIE